MVRNIRAASGPRAGVVLTLPNILGTHADVMPLARNSLPGFDVLAVGLDTGGTGIAEPDRWIGLARAVVAAIEGGALPRPAAMAGFSVGGYLGWLIDRMLVAAGHEATPVINLDGGALHLHWRAWRHAVGPGPGLGMGLALPGGQGERMLLMHSATPAPHRLFDSSRADWARLGVAVTGVPVRTLNHPDLRLPATIAAAAASLQRFVVGEQEGGLQAAADAIGADTLGGRLFSALVAPRAPSVAEVSALLQPQLPPNTNVLAAVLLLAAATGDAGFALDVAARVRGVAPNFRPARYAEAALRRESAASPAAAASWEAWPEGVLGSEASLDYAAQFCRAGSSGPDGQTR